MLTTLSRKATPSGLKWAGLGRRMVSNVEMKWPEKKSKVMITCEHAGAELPQGISWGKHDEERELKSMHWAYDPGAKEFAVELADKLGAPAILSKYSRLFVDLNRPLASPTLARKLCDGQEVDINRDLTPEALQRRIVEHYLPYHLALENMGTNAGATLAVSIHTYTDNYEGKPRDFEIGVLYSTNNDSFAQEITEALVKAGFSAKVNAPWSGKDGFMFSVDSFAYNSYPSPGLRSALMFEFRNDCCRRAEWRQRVIEVIAPYLLK